MSQPEEATDVESAEEAAVTAARKPKGSLSARPQLPDAVER